MQTPSQKMFKKKKNILVTNSPEQYANSRNSEIALVPSSSQNLARFETVFAQIRKVKTPLLGLFFAKTYQQDTAYYGLFSDKLEAILILDFERMGKPQIEYVQTSQEYRGKGLLRYLLNDALMVHSEIFSDNRQTAESKTFWENIAKFPQPAFDVFVYDLANGKKEKNNIFHPS